MQFDKLKSVLRSWYKGLFIWLDEFRFFFEALQSYIREGAFFHGAALAYYTLFAMIPLMYLSISIFGRIVGQEFMVQVISDVLTDQIGLKDSSSVLSFLKGVSFDKPSWIMDLVSIVVLMYGGSAFFVSLKRSINDFFGIPRKRREEQNVILSFLSFRFLSIGLLGLFSMLVILFYFLQVFILSAIDKWTADIHFMSKALEYLSTIACNTLIFMLIFKYVHDGKVNWKLAFYGGSITAVLLFVTQLVIRYYLQHYFFLGKLGIAGSIFIILAWVNYSAQMVFLGAKFTAMLGARMGIPVSSRTNN